MVGRTGSRVTGWPVLRGLVALLALASGLVMPASWANVYFHPHQHQFGAQASNLPQPGVTFSRQTARPGQVVELSIYAMMMDVDYCTNHDHEENPVWQTEFDTHYYSQCAAPNRAFQDAITVSCSATGGELGIRDGMGQFQPLAAGQFPTHFRCGAVGTGRVEAAPDDQAQGYDPSSGQLISLYNDTPSAASTGVGTITIAAHQHAWNPVSSLSAPSLSVSSMVLVGQRISVSASTGSDFDSCSAADCPFYSGYATNTVRVSAWTGGTFGYYDGSGQWTVSSNPALITHWEAPAQAGSYTLRADVDDLPTATDAEGNASDTYDDQPSFATTTVQVYDPNVHHTHSFGSPNDPPLQLPTVTFAQPAARPGRVVSLSVYFSQTDEDRCKNQDGACPWSGGSIYDSVHAAYSASGGDLGTLDGAGQFQPLGSGQAPTHFLCGTNSAVPTWVQPVSP